MRLHLKLFNNIELIQLTYKDYLFCLILGYLIDE